MPTVTVTTDFGTRDPYVAAMKGVLLSACPAVQLIDLTHEISPQSILEGSLFLASTVSYFPTSTIHVAVVDPGVGTERRPLAVSIAGQVVVCPDNGLLTLLQREHPVDAAHVIEEPRFRRSTPSATFHGRDLFAPAAARLACGAAIEEVGPPAGPLVSLPIPEPALFSDEVRGEVIHVDHFGNLMTNIHRRLVGERSITGVDIGDLSLPTLLRTYGDAEPGAPIVLIGSAGYLEIAVREGNAAKVLGQNRGDVVTVRLGLRRTDTD